MNPTRRIVLVAFDHHQALDLIGPNEVFSVANRIRPGSYYVEIVAPAWHFCSWSGVRMEAHSTIASEPGPIDTLIVAGGDGVRAAQENEALIAWIGRAAERCRRLASVCTGAFLLARAGLLDGREATTHWASCPDLKRRYPQVDVKSDPIFVRSGNVYTSAGVTAGIDLSLALVEEDLGPKVARDVARWLVLYLRRPGGQSQFSAALAGQQAEREPLRELQGWMVDHLDDDLSVPALAVRAYMSPRNFARAFKREVGMTPGVYVETLRVERARMLLEGGDENIEQVARRCGFGTVETMRRSFRKRLGVSPGDYRDRFQRRAA
ncbi:MAG TPA: GlxA family transcriptional regulator [Thermoleophilaceae bacterium]